MLVIPFPEVDVPLDIVTVVLLGQSTVQGDVLLEMPEVGLEGVGGLRDARVVEEVEHVGQGAADMHVCLP